MFAALMMQHDEPVFLSYTYEELLSARKNIDQVKYPDRLAKIESLLSQRSCERRAEKDSSSEQLFFWGVLSAEMVFWLVILIASLFGYSIF